MLLGNRYLAEEFGYGDSSAYISRNECTTRSVQDIVSLMLLCKAFGFRGAIGLFCASLFSLYFPVLFVLSVLQPILLVLSRLVVWHSVGLGDIAILQQKQLQVVGDACSLGPAVGEGRLHEDGREPLLSLDFVV